MPLSGSISENQFISCCCCFLIERNIGKFIHILDLYCSLTINHMEKTELIRNCYDNASHDFSNFGIINFKGYST